VDHVEKIEPEKIERPAYRWLTPPQLAEIMGVEPPKVIAWIKRGELRAVNVADCLNAKRPRWRIPPEAFEDFVKARESKPAPRITRRKRKSETEDVFGLLS